MARNLHRLIPAARAVDVDMELVATRAQHAPYDSPDRWPGDTPADALEFEIRFEVMSAVAVLLEGGATPAETVDALVQDHPDLRADAECLVHKVGRLLLGTIKERERRSCHYCLGPLAVRDSILSVEDLLQGNIILDDWRKSAETVSTEVRLRCLRCWAEHSGTERR